MKRTWILLPLFCCLLLGTPALADDEPAPDTKAAVRDALEREVSVTFRETPVDRVVEYLAKITGLVIRVEEGVEGEVTLEIEKASAGTVLHAVAEAADLEIRMTEKGVLELYKPKPAKRYVKEIDFTRAREAAAAIDEHMRMLKDKMELLAKQADVAEHAGDEGAADKYRQQRKDLASEYKRLAKERKAALKAARRVPRAVPAPPVPPMPPLPPKPPEGASEAAMKARKEAVEKLRAAYAARKRAEDELAATAKQAEKLVRRARELERHAEELREAKRFEEAEKHKQEARELREKARVLRPEWILVPGEYKTEVKRRRDADRAEIARLLKHAQELHKKANAARKAGRTAEATKLDDEVRAIKARLAQHHEHAALLEAKERAAKRGRRKPGERAPEDAERRAALHRLEHLRTAMRSLRAAGLHEEGKRVEREIHELEMRLHAHEREHEGHGDVMHALRALQNEVRSLRADVRGLTALVKKLMAEEKARR